MRIVDLFCGSGGMSLGMQRAGHQIICGFDFDKHALAVHAANIRSERKGILARVPLRDPHRKADLSNLLMYGPEIADLNADVIVGGPPCVAFSTANPDRGDDKPAARLTESFAACVLLSRPRYFVMENVQEAQASVFWKRSVRLLKRAGYGLTTYEMDMSWFGVGQARERVFLLGAIGEADGWATCYLDAAKDTKRTTVRDILGSRCADLYFRIGWRGDEGPTGGRRSFLSTDEPGATLTSTADRRASSSKKGYVLRHADIEFFEKEGFYFTYRGGQSSAGTRRLDDPFPTITRNSCYGVIPSYVVKAGDVIGVEHLPTLPLEDIAALAGYPADYNWHPGPRKTPKGARMKMFANSVPAPIAEILGRVLTAHQRWEQPRIEVTLPEDFQAWLIEKGGVSSANAGQRAGEVRAALRLLGSRMFRFEGAAARHLGTMPAFQRLPPARRSNLLGALRLFDRYRVPRGLIEVPEGADYVEVENPFPTRFRIRPTSRSAVEAQNDGGEAVLLEPLAEAIPA